MSDLRVVAAAIRENGIVYTVPRPGRHHTVMMHMRDAHGFTYVSGREQGFVLSDGTYADRERAYEVAKAAGQLIAREGGYRKGEVHEGPELYSEDVW